MHARGDREHDIAAWFGVNQGRVADAKDGRYAGIEAAPTEELPPRGAPGIKGRRLRSAVDLVLGAAEAGDITTVRVFLRRAISRYDENEA
jgi:hypothetical protein